MGRPFVHRGFAQPPDVGKPGIGERSPPGEQAFQRTRADTGKASGCAIETVEVGCPADWIAAGRDVNPDLPGLAGENFQFGPVDQLG